MLIIMLILLLTIFLVIRFNKIVTPKILQVTEAKINSMISVILHKSFEKDIVGDTTDILVLDINNDQINGVNFNMEKIYELAKKITDKVSLNIKYMENGEWERFGYHDIDAIKSDEGYILAFPIGIASDNIFMANLGPKIPVKIRMVSATLNYVETKITDYGINNALVEVYININIENQLLTPVVMKRDKQSYRFLVSSRIINGKVPSFYNGLLTKGTNLNIPIS